MQQRGGRNLQQVPFTKMARAFSLVLLLACLVASALSFAPAAMRARPSALSMQLPSTPSSPSSTRSQRIAQLQRFSATFAPAVAALVAAPLLSRAAEAVAAAADAAPVKVPLGPPPTNFGLAFKDFYTDCQQVRFGVRGVGKSWVQKCGAAFVHVWGRARVDGGKGCGGGGDMVSLLAGRIKEGGLEIV